MAGGAGPPPDAPTGLIAVPGVSSVTLYWTNPGNSEITEYEYQVDGFGWADMAGSNAATTMYVASAGNGAALRLRIRAFAGPSAGAESAWVSATPQSAAAATLQSLSPTSVTVTEGAAAEMVVRLSANAPADVQVYFSASGGTATKGADYPAGTLTGPEATAGLYRATIPAGSRMATLSIATTDDDVFEGITAETFTVAITHIVSTAVIGEPTVKQFTVNLEDNDSGIVLSATSVTVAEPTGSATYIVKLATQPTHPVAVSLSWPPGGVVRVAPTVLNFNRNNWNTAQMVTVTAMNDNIDNTGDSRSTEITHTPFSSDGRFSRTARLRATVTDDDTRGYTFAPTALTVAERGSRTYTVALNSQPTGNVTVTVTSNNADVTVDTDADTDGDQNTLTFTAGDWNTARTVTVSAARDADETDDSATLTHTGVGGDYGSISGNTLTVTVDDRPLPTVALSVSASGAITEGANPLIITATRSEANDSGSPIVIPIRVKADGTTAEPADYTLAGSISIASTESTGEATFAVANDNADEPPETVIVELGALPAGNEAGDDGEVEITITDNDATTVTLAGAVGNVAEGDTKTFTLSLGRGLFNGEALTVPLSFAGTATRGTDYTTACASATGAVCQDLNNVGQGNNPRVTFTGPSSGATATSVTLTLTAAADGLREASEAVQIGFGTLSGTGLGGGTSTTDSLADFSITNDPAPTAALDMPEKINSTAAFTATVTFNEAVTGFAAGDIMVTGGTAGTFNAVSTMEYTLSVTPTSGSDVTVTVGADSATDGGSNTGPESAVAATAVWDATAPTLSIRAVPSTITDTTAFTVEFDFSEPVTGFETGDITVTGGAKGALTDGTDNYELSVTPTGDADVVITVPANAVTDGANTGPAGDVTATATWIPPGVTTAQPADRTVTEGDTSDTATFTVALATEPSSAVTVTVTAPAGLELDGPDSSTAFSAIEALTFATNAWSTAQTVTVRAIDDSTDSPRGRQLTVTYAATSSDGDYSGLTGTAATVTVVDDDATEVTLAGAAGNVEEGNTKEFTVTLNRGLVNGEALPVPLAFGGAATRGTDYTTACPTTLPDGVTCNNLNTATTPTVTFTGPSTGATATSVTLTLSATGDSMEEGSETVTIGLGALDANSGSGLGGGASGSGSLDFSITDPNRAPTVAKALPGRQAPVGQAFSYQFPADAFTDADGDTLDYTATQGDGTALPTWLTFTEATRTFSGTPQSGNAGTLTVRVTADDGNGGTVQDTFTLVVAAAAATVSLGIDFPPLEGFDNNAEVKVSLSPTLSAEVEVYLSATDVTATKGDDYAAGTQTGPDGTTGLYKVTLAANTTSATLSIALTNDTLLEGEETFTVAVADIVSTSVIGRAAPLTIAIGDDELPFVASAYEVVVSEESGSREGSYTLRLYAEPTAEVTVAVVPAPSGVATAAPASLTFTADDWNVARTVTVTALDDDIVNPLNSTFGARGRLTEIRPTGTSDDGRFEGLARATAIFVNDDDTAGLAFTPAALTVPEGGSNTYTVALTSEPSATVTVAVAGASGEVTFDTGPADGVQTTPLTFTTDTWNTPQTVTVLAADDADTTNDSATLTHTASGGDYASVTGDLEVTVTDDDSPSVTLAVSAASITEGGTALTLTATRSEANASGAALEFPIRVKADGTTAESGDYTLATSISIPNNMSSGTTTFTAIDDNADEPAETVVVELHTLPSGTELGAATEVAITITDNDATAVTLSGDNFRVSEGRNDKTFTVSLGRGLEAGETLTVPLTIAGTATRGTDYTLSCDSAIGVSCEDLNNTAMNNNPRVTFTGPDAGATAASVTLRVAAVDDGAWETNGETVDVSPGTPTGTGLGGGVAAPADNLPVFRILDPYGLVFTPAAINMNEGATVNYTVALSREPNLAVTVTVASDNSDVTFDTDSGMAGSQNTLGFTTSDWATGKTVTVSAAQDDDTADDSATLTHTGSGAGSLYGGVTGDLMVTVNDDDADGVTVAETGGGTAVTEGGGDEDTFTVVLDTPPGGPAEVFAAAASGVELEGPDPNLDFSASERIGFSRQTGNPGGWDGPRTVRVRATAASENGTDTPGSRTAVEVTFTTNELGAGTAYDDLDVPALSVDVIDNDPTSVTLARAGGTGLVAEGGTATLTVTLGRDLIAGETVTAPLTVSGTSVTLGDYTLILASGGSLNNGVTLNAGSPYSAAQPAVVFTGSDTGTQQVATLTLTAVADGADESNETLSVGFGSVTSNLDRADASTSGTGGTSTAGAPVAITVGTVDTAAPTATLTNVPAKINDRTPFTATVTFNEPVTGFAANDITVAGGAKGAFTPVSTTEYTLVVTPAGGGANVEVTVLADSATDGNSNTGPAAAVVETAVWDATAPTLDITGLPDKINDRTARTVTFTFSEAVTGFATGDVSVSGGAKGAFAGDDGDTEYTLLVTPAGSADVVVTVAANAATDGANTGPASQQSETAEWDTTAPTLSITGLPGKINDRTPRTVTFTFSEAVTGFATGDVTVSGGVKGAFTGGDGDTEYTLSVTPNDGADVTVTVAANAATDGANTGPASQQAETAEWDATAPTLAISGLPEKINDRTVRTVTFTFSEAVTGFATGDVSVSGGVKGAFTGGDGDTEYTLSVTPNDGADVTVTVAANAATDGANTAPASQQSETAEWDATAPTLEISGLPASIDSTAALTATFTFSEAVTGFAADDITVAGGTAGAFASTSATVYTLMVTPAGSADVVVTVRADAATDGLNTGPASAEEATAAWEPPAAPMGLTATPGNARVFLNWTNPSDSDIDKYQVRQGTGTTFTWGEWTDIGSSTATTTIHTVTGLANGTEYSFQIRAVDGTAESTESNTAVATPAAALVFTPASLNVNEGMDRTYTVALASRPTDGVTVTVASDNADVTFDTNSGSPGNQSILSFSTTTWGTAQTVTVAAAQDDDTTNDTATLSHSASGGGYGSVAGDLAVTVTDDDSPSVALSASAAGITEGGTALTLTATRSEANTSGATLNFPIRVKTAGTTAQGNDYTALAANISILNNASTGTATFAVIDDNVDEPPETVVVELHAPPSGTVLGATREVEITITDNDATEVTLSVPDATAAEGSGTDRATLRLSLNRALRAGESLGIPLAFSGAALGTDFTLALSGAPTGVALSGGTVTFTGSGGGSATSADVLLSASADADGTDETVTVGIPSASSGAPPILAAASLDGGATGSRTGNGRIVLSDTTPVVSFAAGSGTVAENGGTRNVALSISPAPAANITVNYTVGGTATEDTDFSITGSGTVTVAANAGSVNIPVAVTDDDADESAETVILTLNSGTGYAVGSANVHTLTITDNDTPALAFSATSLTVDEGSTGSYTVRLATLPTGSVTVAVASDNADVTFDTNSVMAGSQSTLSFTTTTWSTAQTVTVSAGQDVDMTNDTATLSHGATGGGYGSVTGDVAVTVTDDDSPSVTLSASAAGITEGGTALTLTATRSAANNSGATLNFPIRVKAQGTTAQGNDYTLAASSIGILNNASTGTTTFAVTDDSADEPPETVVVELHTPPSGTVLGATREVEITIADNDATTVTLAGAAGNVAEGDTKTFTVTLGRGLVDGEVLPVPLTFGGGATRNTDYTTACPSTLPTGVTCQDLNNVAQGNNPRVTFTGPSANAVTLTLSATADSTDETGDETVDIDLGALNANSGTGLGGGASGSTTLATFSITDPSALPVLTISGGAAVTEGGAASFTVTAVPTPTSTLIINRNIADAPGADFLADTDEGDNGFWVFSSGQASRTFTVQTVADGTDEPSGPVTVTLRPRPSEYALGAPASATVTVNDDDGDDDDTTPVVSFAAGSGTVAEDGGTRNVALSISPAPAANITVNYTVSGTAGSSDFSITGSGTVTVASNTGSVNIPVAVTDDDADESAETVILTLSSGTGYAVGSANAHTLTITDNDTAALAFSATSLTVGEGSTGSYTVRLATLPTGSVTVAVASDNADVTFDTNSVMAGSQSTLSFTTTTWNAAQTVTVSAGQDVDMTNDTATLSHGATGGGYGSVTGDVAVTVTDDDSPNVTLSASAAGITEGGTALTLTATRSAANNSGATLNFPIRVKAQGTTAQGNDYTALAANIGIANNASTGTATFAVTDDNMDEPPETVVVELHTPPSGTVLGATREVEITIADNDATAVTLAGAAGNVAEGDTKTFTVTLGRGLVDGEALPVPLAFAGTATRGADYATACASATGVACQDLNNVAQGSNPRVTFTGPSAAGVTLTLSATADGNAETGGETVAIDLGALNASSGTNLGGGASGIDRLADFRITDAPSAPAVSVSSPARVYVEGDAVRFKLTARPAPSADVRVQVRVAQTGRFADRRDLGRRTVPVGAGGTAALTVRTVDDAAHEADGAVRVTVLPGSGYSPHGSRAAVSVTVRDNDPRPVNPQPGGGGGGSGGGGSGGGGGGQQPEAAAELGDRALPSGGALSLDLSEAFRSPGGSRLAFTATSSDPTVASASVEDGTLAVRGLLPGAAEITVTATDGAGRSISQRFEVTVGAPEAAWLMPPASDPFRQGFVRVVNHSGRAGEATVTATDDAGRHYEPLTLRMEAHAATHFNSADLEEGNAAKGLPEGTGPGEGAWRLTFGSDALDVEALGLLRTADGFVTAMRATAPRGADGALRLLTFNPASNFNQVSRLRLVNPTDAEARATVTGTDDAGASPGSPVVLTLPAGSACEVDAAALESGRGLACGAPQAGLGDGTGKWRLTVASDAPLVAMGLLSSPGGHLTNLSGTLPEDGRGVRHVAFLPPASDPHGRQGFVRVANLSGRAGTVAIRAFDDGDARYEPLALRLGAGGAAQFNSDDLELGNPRKGLAGSTGSGTGAWRLELSGAGIEFEAGAYVRHADGFLTAVQAVAPSRDGVHRVATFNPGSNTRQVSVLRLVNRGSREASVSVTGADDGGVRGGPVEVRVPAGSAVELTAAALESGEAAAIASGALGDGRGKWRLRVASEGELSVMGLMSSVMGRLANWSGADAARGVPPLPSLLPPPASVAAEDAGGRRVRGEWDAVAGARYAVELLLDGAPVEGRSLSRTTRTSFRWSGLAPGAYALRVRSVDADGQAGPWSPPTPEVVID